MVVITVDGFRNIMGVHDMLALSALVTNVLMRWKTRMIVWTIVKYQRGIMIEVERV